MSNTYTGTHYINVCGGNIDYLCAGTFDKHRSGSAVLDISGGNIDSLYLSENGSRLNGTAKVTLSGGVINEFMCYAAIEGSDVTLSGTKVGKMLGGLTVQLFQAPVGILERKFHRLTGNGMVQENGRALIKLHHNSLRRGQQENVRIQKGA